MNTNECVLKTQIEKLEAYYFDLNFMKFAQN